MDINKERIMEKTLFVIGAGKGLGNAVARKFAEQGFRTVLMCRSAEHLTRYQENMQSEGFQVATQTIDASDQSALVSSLRRAMQSYGVPDVVFYNVGTTTADSELPEGLSAEVMRGRYESDVLGAWSCLQLMDCEAFRQKQGAVLITGGGLSLYPSADYLPLSMDKAALRAMVLALHPVLRDRGIFLGSVQVCGLIGGSEKYMPENIAEQVWNLYQARSDAETVY